MKFDDIKIGDKYSFINTLDVVITGKSNPDTLIELCYEVNTLKKTVTSLHRHTYEMYFKNGLIVWKRKPKIDHLPEWL